MPERRYDPPSAVAARRAGGRQRRGIAPRAYPVVDIGDDLEAVHTVHAATRSLLAATSGEDVANIVRTLVHDLGGGLVPARLASAAALPIDVSLGLGEPLLVHADEVSVARMRLGDALPTFLEDAKLVCARLAATERGKAEAELDVVTGVLTRRAWMRRLAAADAGDAVALIDLDHFKQVNDARGHAAGDEVLAAVGRLLRDGLRDTDAAGRYGGDEFACLASRMRAPALADRLDALRSSWAATRPEAGAHVGLSIGVSEVRGHRPREALRAADRALYRAKDAGRDRTELAQADDCTEDGR